MKIKSHIIIGIILLVLSAAACSSDATKTQPVIASQSSTENPIDNGKVLFEEKCVLCHGADGTAGISNAADLQKSTMDTISIIKTISNGKNAMPAFSEQLGAGEIEQITNYAFTLRK
jgi:mono/diheme cytochrome c family protein